MRTGAAGCTAERDQLFEVTTAADFYPLGPAALTHSEHGHTPSEHSLDGSPAGEHSLAPTPAKHRAKAPPIDPYTGEDPEVRLDNWLPALKQAASWNEWLEMETLIHLVGHLRG